MSDHSTKAKRVILEHLHSTERSVLSSHMFHMPTKICLLDFIGASDYFITEYGNVWPRAKCFPNKAGYLNKGWLPMVIRDRRFPYHWVQIPTVNGPIWYPVNQLLGWAFCPTTEIVKSYFLSQHAGSYPYNYRWFTWTTTRPDITGPSLYLDFIDQLYAE